MTKLSKSAQKIQDALNQKGLGQLHVVELPDSARTAAEAAQAIGTSVAQIAKSLVFKTADERGVLVIASGTNRVDEKKVGRLLGQKIKRADADFVRRITGFAIGGIPPLGHDAPLEIFIDQDLLQYSEVWAAAGTPHAVFCLDPAQLETMTGGTLAPIAKESKT